MDERKPVTEENIRAAINDSLDRHLGKVVNKLTDECKGQTIPVNQDPPIFKVKRYFVPNPNEELPRRDCRPRKGHPRFHRFLDEMSRLHDRKNADYAGDGDPLGNFKRCASIFSNYPGLKLSDPVVFAYALRMKQLDAILWTLSQGGKLQVESITDKAQDDAVYSVIARVLMEENEEETCGD
jgi:hypothetical protein